MIRIYRLAVSSLSTFLLLVRWSWCGLQKYDVSHVFIPLQVVGDLVSEGKVQMAVHDSVATDAGAQPLRIQRQQRGARAHPRPRRYTDPRSARHVAHSTERTLRLTASGTRDRFTIWYLLSDCPPDRPRAPLLLRHRPIRFCVQCKINPFSTSELQSER